MVNYRSKGQIFFIYMKSCLIPVQTDIYLLLFSMYALKFISFNWQTNKK